LNEFRKLAIASEARQQEWDPMNRVTLSYRGNELAGEIGEALEACANLIDLGKAGGRASNIIKKLERERLGIKGSRATKEQAAEELADVVICATLVALDLDIDLWPAVVAKFNKTSDAVGLSTHLEEGNER
jgi:NTP pyrophosphatase (non-canonical NTP hydrolase)